MVQRIMNSVEKTSTGVTPAEVIWLQARILAPPTSLGSAQQIALSDTMDEWISKQHTLIIVARETQLATHSSNMTHGSPSTLSAPTCSSQLPSADPTSYYPGAVVPLSSNGED